MTSTSGVAELLSGEGVFISSGIVSMQPLERSRGGAEITSLRLARYGGWFLAVLLLLFCASARRGPLHAHNANPRPITQSIYIENNQTRLGASLVLLLLVWWLTRSIAPAGAAPVPLAIGVTNSGAKFAGGFGRDLHIRPPPRW